MKNINYLFITLITMSFALTSCGDEDILSNSLCDHITVNIKNDTGIDIHNFTHNDENLGLLNAGGEIKNICIDNVTMDGEFPLIYFTGIMNEDEIMSIANTYWCGTGMHSESEGLFNIELKDRSEWNDKFVNYEAAEN